MVSCLIFLICLLITAIYFQSKKIKISSLKAIQYNGHEADLETLRQPLNKYGNSSSKGASQDSHINYINNSELSQNEHSFIIKPTKETIKNYHNYAPKTYYIDSIKGNDRSSGTSIKTAWRDFSNIKKRSFSKGDTILLKRGGVWNKTLFPPAGGDGKESIIIDAYGDSGPLPVIDVQNKYPAAIRIYYSYVSIGNIKIENSVNDCLSIAIAGGLKNIKLKNIKIFNAGNNGIGVSKGGTDLAISRCYIENSYNNGIYLGGSAENKLSNVIISSCYIKKTLHNDGITIHEDGMGNTAGSNFLLKNNTSEMCAEQGFDITSGKNVLLLNNISDNNKQGGILVGHSAQKVTIRGHISTNEPTEKTAAAIYLSGDYGNIRVLNSVIKGNGYHLLSIHTNNVAVFNNDFIWNGGGAPIDIEGRIENIHFINNIVYSKQYKMSRIRFLEVSRPPDYAGFHFDYNLYYTPDNDVIFYYNTKNYKFKKYQKVFNVEIHSQNINPEFIEPFQDNYQLKNTSPAIDRGCFYTHSLSQGAGNKLLIKNALFFYKNLNSDDYQRIMLKGVEGVFNIINVNYKNNIIYLDKAIKYGEADAIGLCYKKSSLDIGAYEFGSLLLPISKSERNFDEKNYYH